MFSLEIIWYISESVRLEVEKYYRPFSDGHMFNHKPGSSSYQIRKRGVVLY